MFETMLMQKAASLLLCAAALIGLPGCGIGSVESEDTQDMEVFSVYEYETQELWCGEDGNRIYGVAYIPEREGPAPLVIFAHELGNTHASGTSYAKELAIRGLAVYTFDFRGGSTASRSDGETTEMSVMTEADDLEMVMDAARDWDFADSGKIVLLGGSQGGMAAAVAAAREPERITGLIMMYPAFVIPDTVHGEFDSLEDIPEAFNLLGWIWVGRNYAADVWDYDLYGEMQKYTKPVLLLHGNRDGIVDISYSERAAESYPNVEFHTMRGAGHGFYGSSFDEAMKHILNYLQNIQILEIS